MLDLVFESDDGAFVLLPWNISTAIALDRNNYLTTDMPKNVRDELPHWKVASTCVQAEPIADEVIPAKGYNKFLGSGWSIHRGIGNDFKFLDDGTERKV
jgi:hypothetical protein